MSVRDIVWQKIDSLSWQSCRLNCDDTEGAAGKTSDVIQVSLKVRYKILSLLCDEYIKNRHGILETDGSMRGFIQLCK